MENSPIIFSVVFCMVCAISSFLGIYTLYLNSKSISNRIFFALSVSMNFWAFGFMIAISASDLSTCLFWRRFSAIGWGTFFSIILHFFLALTGRTSLFDKKWFYILLYSPSLVNILGFTYFPGLNPEQYNMLLTKLGWVNISANNLWDWFFTINYLTYSAISLFYLWQWGKKSENKKVRKQSRYILFSFLITLITGSIVDIFSASLFKIMIPQMAPLIMLFPMAVIFYTIKKFGLLNSGRVGGDTVLMSEQIRSRIINYMSNAFLAASFINIIALYLFFKQDLSSVLLFSGILIFLGVVLQAIQRSKFCKSTKDVLLAAFMSAMVPIFTFKFLEFGSVTIWAFAFILLIITLVFENRIMQITLVITIIFTQVTVWMLKPQVYLVIDKVDYITRIGMYGIAFWFAFFIKKMFLSKLNENADQISSQSIITEISTDFVSVNDNNFEEKTDKALSKLGDFYNIDRAYIYLFSSNKEKLICRHHWINTNLTPKTEYQNEFFSDQYPCILSRLMTNEIFQAADIEDISGDIYDEIKHISWSDIKSLIILPVTNNGVCIGFLGLEAYDKKTVWVDTQVNILKIMSNIIADAVAKVNQEREINFMAYYDNLTRLPNRLFFKNMVNQSIGLAKETDKILAIIFIDLDSFKNVNDTMGHDIGDELLIEVSDRLLKSVGQYGTVARFGGDEFIVLLNNIGSIADIDRVGENIIRNFRNAFNLRTQEFFITTSAGISVYPNDGDSADKLIKNADIAMYKAKEKGKNQFLICSTDMKYEIENKMKLINYLYRALEKNEFVLHYQPQVCIESGKIVGIEALIRWQHPELGMVPPNVFIPLAEHTGLIIPIGEWVIKTACKQCKAWQDSGLPAVHMAVNLSIHQLRNPNIVSTISKIIKETGLDPKYVELEITESAAFCESENFMSVLDKFKELGISIAIDDFGTEYSSLSRLNMMPIDKLKLDMQFIKNIDRSDKDKAIAIGIINLAQNLGLKVVAEGVEDQHQLVFLRQNGCDEVQGFYFYRPSAAHDIELALKDSVSPLSNISKLIF